MTLPNGRVRLEAVPEAERHMAIAMHLTPFAGIIFPLAAFTPLVLWLIVKDKQPFAADHGREAVNLLITSLIVTIACTVSAFTIVGLLLTIPAMCIWVVVAIISQIRGAIAASNGEYFRYPMNIRFV